MFDIQAPPLAVAEILDAPDQAAAMLVAERPGPDALAALSMLDPATLTRAGRVDALVAIERHLAWLAGEQQRVLASLAEDAPPADPVERMEASWVREDVACALRLSAVTADHRLAVAQTLTGKLPATLTALRAGAITYLHAMSLADAVHALDAAATSRVEERVLSRARQQTLAQFRASVRRAVAAAAPARLDELREQAMAERRVCVSPRDDGMSELWALLPAEGAAAVMAAIDSLASVTSADDARTADQRRADALVDLGVAALHDPLLPRSRGMRPAVQVTVALSTLLGLDSQPGELAGHGPIPADVARRIAADPSGTWRRLVTDPATGQLLDYGRRTYRPPSDLARYVIARDRTCVFPTCNRSAHRCDLDHRLPFDAGGATCAENLAPLCRRHHAAKHRAGWRLHRQPDGSYRWASPTGHLYAAPPADYPATDYPADRTGTDPPG